MWDNSGYLRYFEAFNPDPWNLIVSKSLLITNGAY